MTRETDQAGSPSQSARVSLAEMVAAPSQALAVRSVGGWLVARILLLTALLVTLNFWQLRYLFGKWQTDPNWSHGFLIPLFSLYLVYARRDELLSAKWRPCVWGLPVMILGILVAFAGFYPIRTYWFSQLGMVLEVLGLVLYLGGTQVIRVAWLPICYLVLALPIPDMLYTRIALPLQEFAAKGSTVFLQLMGVEMDIVASHLKIISQGGNEYGLTVAEACSGIRSLIAYVALGVAWAYLEDRPIWQRVLLVSSAVPIAVFLNVVRVTLTCSAYVIDRPELGQDFMHSFMGMVMLIPALVLFWLLAKLLDNLFVDVEEEDDDPAPRHPQEAQTP